MREPVEMDDHISVLTPDPENRRKHTERNIDMLATSLQRVGAGRSIVIDEGNVVLAGNATIEAAAEVGITKLKVVEADGHTIVAVRRVGLTPEQKRLLAMYDNRVGELAGWDQEQLLKDSLAGLDLSSFFTEKELGKVLQVPSSSDPHQGMSDPLSGVAPTTQTPHVACPACGHSFVP